MWSLFTFQELLTKRRSSEFCPLAVFVWANWQTRYCAAQVSVCFSVSLPHYHRRPHKRYPVTTPKGLCLHLACMWRILFSQPLENITLPIWNSMPPSDSEIRKKKRDAWLKVHVKFEHFQQVLDVEDERRSELVFAVGLFTACRKHYKEREGAECTPSPSGLTFFSAGRPS